jgi:predicted DNA-binding transcriptional regulator YafY
MSQQGTIKRYQLILEQLQSSIRPSFALLKEHLHSNGFEISPRTLQRDIQHIRDEFGIDILYHKPGNYYYINTSTSEDVPGFLRFLHLVQSGNALSEQFHRHNLPYMDLSSEITASGMEWMNNILAAARKNLWVTFSYRKFGTEKAKSYKLQPYLLKEYRQRWYLLGREKDHGPFKTFGLDRIIELTLTTEKFVRDNSTDLKSNFKNVIGIVYDNGRMQQVQLAVTPTQAGYLRTLPLHHTQQEVSSTPEEVIFSYSLIPNYELMQQILMMGNQCRVLAPGSLRKEIHDMALAMVRANG